LTAKPLIKLETPRQFYDYEAKYLANTTKYICPCGLEAELEARLAEQGLRAFTALGASAWGRVDFMLDANGQPHFIELNTVPGMTDHSLVPMAASAFGWRFEELVLRILALSFERAV
jgi:D-alanine-D-alanine ligase